MRIDKYEPRLENYGAYQDPPYLPNGPSVNAEEQQSR
jgi:hypothetical protein